MTTERRATHPSTRGYLRPVVPRPEGGARSREGVSSTTHSATKGPLRRRGLAAALVVAARPRQWVKNVLVAAAPAAAGELSRGGVALRTAAAAGLFLAASAGTYLVNDAIDAPADRVHPEKRHRPIAAGEVPIPLAVALGGALLVVAIAGAALLAGGRLAAVIGAYVVISTSYSLGLKRIAVVELACVASGFVLRAVAGGAASHLPISPWFAIVTSASALLVVAGKRSAEIEVLGAGGGSHRRVLDEYTPTFLRTVRVIGAAVAIISYGLWAFARAAHIDAVPPFGDNLLIELSVVPFVIGVLSVELAIETGGGGAPEELVLRNRTVQGLALACIGLVAAGIYT